MSGNRNALQPQPKKARGVRRLNSWPTWIAGGMVGVAVAATGWNYEHRAAQNQNAAEHLAKEPLPVDASSLDGLIRENNVHQALYRPPLPTAAPPKEAAPKPMDMTPASSEPAVDAAENARRQAWLTYYANEAQIEQARFTAERAALTADTSLGTGQTGTDSAASAAGIAGRIQTASLMPQAGSNATIPPDITGYGYGPGFPMGEFNSPAIPDTSGAREKQAFMANAGNMSGGDTLMATVRSPVAPDLLPAGDFLTCVSLGGEHSDAPGMFVGRVMQNIYDSATGRYLLIPQGSKVVGVYDNAVSQGQTRIPTAITRIIFPDSESIDLGSMPAADQSGFAGLHDQVNTHWWAKFGNALILGIAGAGVQLSQGTHYNGDGYNAQQIAAASLGQQFAELGAETARSGLSIPDTLVVRPGYRFTIQVTKDIVLRPYVDQRTSGSLVSLGPVLQ